LDQREGCRLEAVKSEGRVTVHSRRHTVLNRKLGYIAEAFEDLPDETVVDGKLVAMDEEGRSNFNLLQNFKSAESKFHIFSFDVLVLFLISRNSASRRLQSTRFCL
jgi:ATP-dependent DNA ligase